jgi:hypothetical protein
MAKFHQEENIETKNAKNEVIFGFQINRIYFYFFEVNKKCKISIFGSSR